MLYNHQGQILTHEQIIEKIWGWSQPAETGTLRTLVSRIRAKLQIGIATPLKIEHVNGIGYRLRIESQIDN